MQIKGMLKILFRWSKMRITTKAACITAVISAIVSLIGIVVNSCSMKESNGKAEKANLLASEANLLAEKAYLLAKEVFEIQNTPRLSTQVFGQSYVGPLKGRIDEVVTIPIAVYNNSDTFAYKVNLDLLISDGTGREVSLNEYFKSVNAPMMYKESLSPREQWLILPPKAMSSPANSKELYSSGKLEFKAKLQLTWKDVKGKEYKFVNLAKLQYVCIEDETKQEAFWFDSKGAYSSIEDRDEVEKHWGLKFNY